MTDLLNDAGADRGRDDDPTIDGADLLDEIRARFDLDRLDHDRLDHDRLDHDRPEAPAGRAMAGRSKPLERWSPPVADSPHAPPSPVRPGLLQIATLVVALLTGLALVWMVLESTATP